MVDAVVPEDLWTDDLDGVLLGWMFASGDPVREGAVIAEVTVEKSQFEIFAPSSGTLTHKVEEDAIIRPGDLIATID